MKTTDRYVLSVLLAGVVSACSAATIAHWTFGEHGLEDVSGNGHALQGVNVEYGANGWATFDGTSSYLKTASTLDLTSCRKLTVECWMKPENLSTDFGVVFVSDPPGTTSGGFVLYCQKAAKCLQSQFRSTSGGWDITSIQSSSLPYSEGAWHHVALVMDPSKTWSDKSQLYIDGVKIAGTSSQQNFSGTGFLNQHLYFGGGASYGENKNFFRGGIDDIRITDDALTPDQFLKFPTAGRKMSVEKPEVAFWPFGEDGLADKTGNGFDLSVGLGGLPDLGFANGCLQLNGAAVFNGENAHLITTNALAFSRSPQVTIEGRFWFEESQKLGVLFSSQHAGEVDLVGGFVVYGYLGSILSQLRVRPSTWQQCRMPNLAGALGGWHHVAYVVDMADATSGLASLWIDGVRQSCTLEFGAGFNGALDSIRVTKGVVPIAEFLGERRPESTRVVVQ